MLFYIIHSIYKNVTYKNCTYLYILYCTQNIKYFQNLYIFIYDYLDFKILK